MSNWIVTLLRNNVHLSKEAIRTFRAQDIGDVTIYAIDNGSTDGTAAWLQTQKDLFRTWNSGNGLSVAASWNRSLEFIFDDLGEDYALVVNNDVELRPDTYRHLVADGGGFVTAVGSRDPNKIKPEGMWPSIPPSPRDGDPCYVAPDPAQKRPHPDFSCYLIRREVWDRVGPFDENFRIAFCEDWDYHLRMHKAGITAQALELPFPHHASQTVKNADDKERERIMKQAEENREYFYRKWGVRGGTEDYYKLFGSEAPKEEKEKENA